MRACYGPEDGPGEEALARDEEDNAEDEDQNAEHQGH